MKLSKGAILFITAGMILSACGTAAQSPTETQVPPPTNTPAPTPTQTTSPTPTLAPGDITVREADGMKMVYVPAGEFTMGACIEDLKKACLDYIVSCDYTGSDFVHTVTLDAYWIDQTEVTYAQYLRCMESGACTATESQGLNCWVFKFCGPQKSSDDLSNFLQRGFKVKNLYSVTDMGSTPIPEVFVKKELENSPVVNVNWYVAQNYCTWAGGSLPTDAEWEKAARGTDGRLFPWGNDKFYKDFANAFNNLNHSQPVGSYPKGASPYGVLDMAGNVAEWVADYASTDYYDLSPASNPTGPAEGTYRVIRGGSWNEFPTSIFTTSSSSNNPKNYDIVFGFRCVQDVKP